MCYTGQHNTGTIVVNHRNNELRARAMARELLTGDEGLMYRSIIPTEPEAVFGQIKYDNHFKLFSYRGKRLVNAEFAAIAVAHNIRKMIAKGYCVYPTATVILSIKTRKGVTKSLISHPLLIMFCYLFVWLAYLTSSKSTSLTSSSLEEPLDPVLPAP